MKPSKKVQRKFNDYIKIHDLGINFDAGNTNYPEEDPNGISAVEAFFQLETFGKQLPTKEPQLLYKALKGKAAFNLQVDMWSQDWTLTKQEFDSIQLPKWCWNTLLKQLIKHYK
mgnify:CR=1 FL=1